MNGISSYQCRCLSQRWNLSDPPLLPGKAILYDLR